MDQRTLIRRTPLGLAFAGLILAGCAGDTGPKGATGASILVSTVAEPAGANCPSGGSKLQVGLDANGNGVLDPSEVNAAGTRYICNGTGLNSLVKTSNELPGANCPFGGVKIETGSDANGNGTLEASEVTAALTSYSCNGQAGPATASTGFKVAVKSVTTSATGPIAMRFTLKDDRGFPVDRMGVYTVNTPVALRFSISYITVDAQNNVLPYTVLSQSNSAAAKAVFQPTAYNPDPTSNATTKTPSQGSIVENGAGTGDYTYTFPAADVAQTDASGTPNGVLYKGIAYDSTLMGNTHTIWIQATRQTNLANTLDPAGYTAVNVDYNFIPNNPTGTPLARRVVSTDGCNNCHRGFTAEGVTSNGFHGGGRINANYCGVCHNPGHTSNLDAQASVYIHRIHAARSLQPGHLFHDIIATYPQDIRNCNACHKGAAQGGQATSRPSLAACGSCHDQVDFGASASAPNCTNPPAVDGTTGIRVPCKHIAGPMLDGTCTVCHTPALIAANHQPIQPPDPNNSLNGGSNANTNAAYLAATGFVPAGAAVMTYAIKSVDAVGDSNGVKRPAITFKFLKDGKDVVFPTSGAELVSGFIGSPSVYFAFAVPQDGVAKPADYNATASGYVKTIWNGTASGSGAGTISGPDGGGYYTITLTAVTIPDSASMLTGGVGYTYSLSNAIPLTQIDLPAFPFDAAKKQGGLIVPAPDVFKVATGFTGRRPIVDNAKCLTCHVTLGAAPTFHAGQRNNGPTCSFCHNPNRTSSAWAANAKDFIHAIHGARKRTVDFTWHATEPGPGFGEIEFPGPLNNCTACHIPNDYDFSSATSSAAVPNMLVSTAATGLFDSDPVTNPTGWFSISPYVVADGVTDYGFGFATSNITVTQPDGRSGTQGSVTCTREKPCKCTTANPCTVTRVTSGKQGTTNCTGDAPCTCTNDNTCSSVIVRTCTTTAPCEAEPATLVKSPIVAACSACHDTPVAIDHMQAMGGYFYAPRSVVLAPGATKEQCLLCHGPTRLAAITDVHK